MATAWISTNTELSLVNTITQNLTLFLPQAPPNGKTLFIKDAAGNSFRSTVTIRPQGSDTFEDGSLFQTLNSAYESIQLNYNSNIWYVTGGMMFNTLRLSTLQGNLVQTLNLSTANVSLSSFQITDLTTSSIGTFNSVSSFLYYNGYNIGGGLRTAIPQTLNNYRFSPYQIPGLTLWLDGADTSTITLNGNNISRWRDKSLTGSDAIQNTVANQPVYSTNAAFFRVSGANPSFFNVNNLGIAKNISAGHFFIVFNAPSLTAAGIANNVGIFSAVNAGGGARYAAVLANAGGSPIIQVFCRAPDTQGLNILGGGSYNVNSNTIASFDVQFITKSGFTYCNGTLTGSNLNVGFLTPTTTNTNSPFVTINSGSLNTNLQNSYVYEILFVTNTIMTGIQRQQVEGYLAWKWGLQSNLPANHPFRNAPP